jgi:hypothetical protein
VAEGHADEPTTKSVTLISNEALFPAIGTTIIQGFAFGVRPQSIFWYTDAALIVGIQTIEFKCNLVDFPLQFLLLFLGGSSIPKVKSLY